MDPTDTSDVCTEKENHEQKQARYLECAIDPAKFKVINCEYER
jgi:hypothetical protein